MTKRSKGFGGDPLTWGTPEQESWAEQTYGPRPKVQHLIGCQCQTCKRAYEWVKGYQAYIRRVDR